MEDSVRNIYGELVEILTARLTDKIGTLNKMGLFNRKLDINELVDKIELPANIRNYKRMSIKSAGSARNAIADELKGFMLKGFLKGLSFPFLSSSVILGSYLTGAHVMYNARPLLEEFAENTGSLKHPHRMLWLTDTLEDANGISMVLKSVLDEIRKHDLPIDILVCSSTLKSGDHLIVVPPLSEFTLPFYQQQPFRIPNVLNIHHIFKTGEYDRLICSTEGPMGLVSMYLKYAFSVPSYFYVHTDWLTFGKMVLNLDQQKLDRVKRILRAYYNFFDGLFVLNTDQHRWLTSINMGFDKSRVFLTAHWAEPEFSPVPASKREIFGVDDDGPVLLFAGRISEEKGVMELPYIYEKLKSSHPDLKIAVAGIGPAEKTLRKEMPDALFMGWVEHNRLPEVYSAADMLLLPSRFDTFGCVVLESLGCGCPVTAYNTKGPKDIIEHGKNGYLASNRNDMVACIKEYLDNKKLHSRFRKSALKRVQKYDAGIIVEKLLKDVRLKA